jgi:membrane peptidoglycan carboxypeptidase
MLDVATSSGFALSGRLAAAKTGTNQLGDTRDNRDAWTVGYTPSLSTAVWVGTDKSDPIRTKSGAVVYGRTLPGPIWQQFMNAALKGAPKDTFSAFEPLGTAAYANNDPSGSSSSNYSSTTPTASPDGNGNDGNDNNDGNGGNRNRGDGNGNDDGNNQGAAFVLPAAGHSVKLRSHSVVG